MLGLLLLVASWIDTLPIPAARQAPAFDARADSAEYGAPSIVLSRPAGELCLWVRSYQGQVYIAAFLPDSTFNWGADLVISLDTGGNRAGWRGRRCPASGNRPRWSGVPISGQWSSWPSRRARPQRSFFVMRMARRVAARAPSARTTSISST